MKAGTSKWSQDSLLSIGSRSTVLSIGSAGSALSIAIGSAPDWLDRVICLGVLDRLGRVGDVVMSFRARLGVLKDGRAA